MAKSNDFSCTLMGEIAITGAKAGWEPKDFSALARDENLMRKILNVVRGELIVQPVPELLMDFIIHVDHSVKTNYPDWVKKVMHSKLELPWGPLEYDAQKLELWLHPDQKSGVVDGNTIYKHLEKGDALKYCLGLADLLAIQSKGIKVFRKIFAGKAVFGWKSVVQGSRDSLLVPYLVGSRDGVVLDWRWLGNFWDSSSPAVRFSK